MKIRCIIFDLGGVLFKNGTKLAIDYLKAKKSIDKHIVSEIFYSEDSFKLRSGTIQAEAYWESIYSKYSDLADIDIRSLWYNSYSLNDKLLNLIRNLKQNYILGILSDNIKERVEFLEHKYNFHQHFNFSIYSFNIGTCKTDMATFDHLERQLSLLNIKNNQTLFIDDNIDCLEVANRAGYNTLHFKGSSSIEKLLSFYDYLEEKWIIKIL